MIKVTSVYQRKRLQDQSLVILFIKPVFKQMIWGGNRLKADFGYDIPGEKTGECWTISAHPNGDCKVYTVGGNSPYDGKHLSQLWKEHKNLFGHLPGNKFPLLLKMIDAKEDLSIQVHPDDAYATKHECGSLGKTECWYIVDCEPETRIVVGHLAHTRAELIQMIEDKRWAELLRTRDIQPGDFFQIEPGTIHAIKAGTLILEIQQSSDITYRLYDYDRLENGKPRELHLEKSIDVITCPSKEGQDCREFSRQQLAGGVYREKLTRCVHYDVDRIVVKGSYTFLQSEPFTILGVMSGEGMIDGISIKKGDYFILPAGYGDYTLIGTLEMIKVLS